MADLVRTNTKRYLDIFSEIVEQLMPKRIKPINVEDVPMGPLRKCG